MSGSVVVDAMRPYAAQVRFLGRDLQASAASFDDDVMLVLLESSVIVQVALAVLARADLAARRSLTARLASGVLERLTALALWQRVRLVALMLFSALVVHLLLTGFDAPEPTVAARTIWVLVGALLVALMAGARSVGAAWVDRSNPPANNQGERA